MKIAFKVMSVLMIIWSAIQIIIGVIALIGSGAVLGAASGVGGGTGAVAGAVGLVTTIISVLILLVAGLMLYTGINGLRGIMDKCKKFTMGFIIYTGIGLGLAIIQGSSVGSSFLQLIFLVVYYILAKNCEDTDGFY